MKMRGMESTARAGGRHLLPVTAGSEPEPQCGKAPALTICQPNNSPIVLAAHPTPRLNIPT